jgi:UDP-N-acetylglucosamine--N-acetylmuramyl-(pentapeptide) pyrophosphoryl-undecaprenol N-acetylglucosamine transferase
LQILHQAGNTNLDLEALYSSLKINFMVVNFYSDIIKFYQAADLIICRAGAGTIFETLFFQKQCITIPLETDSTSHQIQNAQSMATYYPQYFTMLLQRQGWEEKLRSHILKNIS